MGCSFTAVVKFCCLSISKRRFGDKSLFAVLTYLKVPRIVPAWKI